MFDLCRCAGVFKIPALEFYKTVDHVTKRIDLKAMPRSIAFEHWILLNWIFFIVLEVLLLSDLIPEVYWILVLLWAVLEFGIALEW